MEKKTKIRLNTHKLLIMLFTIVILNLTELIYADQCSMLFKDQNPTYDNKERNISQLNYLEETTILNQELSKVLDSIEENRNLFFDKSKILESTRIVLMHAIQNTYQHGSLTGGISHEAALVTTKIIQEGSYILVVISNPQIKPFPNSLLNDFSVGEMTTVPLDERLGYTGNGLGHYSIFKYFANLPSGSTVKWESEDNLIKFTLKLKID